MCDGRVSGFCFWPSAPNPVQAGVNGSGAPTEGSYKELMDRYYSLCERVIDVFGVGSGVGAGCVEGVVPGRDLRVCHGKGHLCGFGSAQSSSGEAGEETVDGIAVGKTVDGNGNEGNGFGSSARADSGGAMPVPCSGLEQCEKVCSCKLVLDDGIQGREGVRSVEPSGLAEGRPCNSDSATSLGSKSVDSNVKTGAAAGPGCLPGETTYERNRRWATERKTRKLRKQSSGLSRCGTSPDVQLSLEMKWKAENKLAMLRADREVALLEKADIDDEARRRRTRVVAATERNMVRIEKTHSQLKASGDVSSDDETRVHTVLTGSGSVSISPNSSVSEAEVRKLVKDNEDLKARNEAMGKILAKHKIEPSCILEYEKSLWTTDSRGNLPEESEEKLAMMYDAYVDLNQEWGPMKQPDGKYKIAIRPVYDAY